MPAARRPRLRISTFAKKWIEKFLTDDTPTLAASLAFYAALSLAPLVILFIGISSGLSLSLQSGLVLEARRFMGADAALALDSVIRSARVQPTGFSLTRLLGFVTLLVSASLLFGQLRAILNRIFNVRQNAQDAKNWWATTLRFFQLRLYDIGWAMGCIGLLTLGLLFADIYGPRLFEGSVLVSRGFTLVYPALVCFAVFTLLFRYLPNCRIPWYQVALGGALTCALFMLGKNLIEFYLSRSSFGTPYGAAGSMIVLLVWVYYSALITFVGAQFSYLLHPKAHVSPKPIQGPKAWGVNKKKAMVALTLLVLLVGLELLIPRFLLRQLNAHLAEFSPLYAVHVGDLSCNLLTMSYTFLAVEARYKANNQRFFSVKDIRVSVVWSELWHGRILSRVRGNQASVYVTRVLLEGSQATKARPKEDAEHVARRMFLVRVAEVQLRDSDFQFADFYSDAPELRLTISSINGSVDNLTPDEMRPETKVNLEGLAFSNSPLHIQGEVRLREQPVSWRSAVELRAFKLTMANPILMRHIPLNFNAGTLDVFAEAMEQRGQIVGYVKPIFKNVRVIEYHKKFSGVKHFVGELLVALGNVVLRRHSDQTVAAEIPFHNQGGKIVFNSRAAFSSAWANGFERKLPEAFDHQFFMR